MKKIIKQEHIKWLGMFLFITMLLFFFSGPAWASCADDLVGTWTSYGVWMRHSVLREYFKLNSKDATMLDKGDFNGDDIEDLVGYWPHLGVEGLRVRYGGNDPQIRWENIEIPPPLVDLISLTASDINGDGKDNIVGSGVEGVFYRSQPGTWVLLLDDPAMEMATGDFNCDGRDDLVVRKSVVDFIIRDGETGDIIPFEFPDDFPPGILSIITLGTGNMNCDCYCDILFSCDLINGSGAVYYLDGKTIGPDKNFTFVLLYNGPEAPIQVTSGDVDGDGCDDLLGVWENPAGVWVRYFKDGEWEKLHNDPALCITAVCFNERMPPE